MAEKEVKRLEKNAPSLNNGDSGLFDPYQVLMVGLDDELFAVQVVRELVHRPFDCISFLLNLRPPGGSIGELLGNEGNGLECAICEPLK